MDTKRFVMYAKRGLMREESYIFGIIHGIQLAICDEELNGESFFSETYSDYMVFVTHTTQEKYDIFRKMIEKLYPGLCEFKE